MKNPKINAKLNALMLAERTTKIELIGCIMDNYKENNPKLLNGDTFDILYSQDIAQLNDIIGDMISNLFAEIHYQIERRKESK
jgi:hypothetical protein